MPLLHVVRARWCLALILSGSLLVLAAPAPAQTPLRAYLSPAARVSVVREQRSRQVADALRRLDQSGLPPELLRNLLRSPSAAPYLADALPKLADLAHVTGMPDLVRRFASNGMGCAYELSVAHAHRQNLRSVSGMHAGHEVDGQLRSGTIVESKSAQPKRPEHLFEQIRRRGSGGGRVLLALGYRPDAAYLAKLRNLSREMGGRLEVQHIPLTGNGYEVLVSGANIEDPSSRRILMPVPKVAPGQAKLGRRPIAPSGSAVTRLRPGSWGGLSWRPARNTQWMRELARRDRGARHR